jgi:hypothetical protein
VTILILVALVLILLWPGAARFLIKLFLVLCVATVIMIAHNINEAETAKEHQAQTQGK